MNKTLLLVFLSLNVFGVSVITEYIIPTRQAYVGEVGPRESSSPIILGDMLFTGNDKGMVDARHRTETYKFWPTVKTEGRVEGSFTYGRSKLFVGDTKGNLYAFHTNDGTPAWEEPVKIKSEWLAPATLFRDKIFITSSDDKVYCYDENGKEIWVYAESGDEKMKIRGKGRPVYHENANHEGVIYQGFTNGYFVALNAETGKLIWRQKLKSPRRKRFYDITLAPVVKDGQVIVSTYDGNLFYLRESDGKVDWQAPYGCFGGFLLDDNVLYFAGLDNHFYAIEKDSKKVKWKTAFEKGVGLAPIRVDDYIIFPTSSDPIYVIGKDKGEVVSKQYLGTGTMAAAAAHPDGSFYALSNYGNLFSFKILKNILISKN